MLVSEIKPCMPVKRGTANGSVILRRSAPGGR